MDHRMSLPVPIMACGNEAIGNEEGSIVLANVWLNIRLPSCLLIGMLSAIHNYLSEPKNIGGSLGFSFLCLC